MEKILIGILAMVICLAISASFVYLIWNFVVASIFGIVELSWIECFGVAVVCWMIKCLLK